MVKVTEILSREHQVVLKKLDAFEKALENFDVEGIRATITFFDERLILHRRKEEELLFPALGRYIGTEAGPIACMLHEHEDEKQKIESIRRALEHGTGPDVRHQIVMDGRYILNLLRNHIVKEDQILFPMAEQTLSENEKVRISEGMKEIGSCCPECTREEEVSDESSC